MVIAANVGRSVSNLPSNIRNAAFFLFSQHKNQSHPKFRGQMMSKISTSDVVKRANAGESLAGENLSNIDLSGAQLSGIDFSRANLNGARLKNSNLVNANFNEADLSGADLSGAALQGAYLIGANLANTNIEGTTLQGAFLGGSILAGTNFRNADLRGATIGCPRWVVPDQFGKLTSFENANLEETIFGETKPQGVVFLDAKFTGAYLYEVDLSEAVYNRSDLKGAIMSKRGRN